MSPVNNPPNNAVEEEPHVEETPQGSWDALSEEFDESDGANFTEAPEVETEPAKSDDAPPEVEAEVAAEPEAKPEITEAEAKPDDPKPEEEPAPELVADAKGDVKPPVAEEETPEPEAPQVPTPEAPPQLTIEQRQELRSQAKKELAAQYVMSDEEAEAWELNPKEALPQLAAELHLQVYETVVNAVMRQIPTVLEATTQRREVSSAKEERFYKRWPELRKYGAQTAQMAHMWTQMNPGASEEKAREEIGKIASAALGLGVQAPDVSSSPPPAGPMTPPATPPVTRPSSKTPSNPYSALADEWAREEEIE